MSFFHAVSIFSLQNATLSLLAVLIIWLAYRQQLPEYEKTGYLHAYYPWKNYLFLAPIYEEVLFRRILLLFVYYYLNFGIALAVSSFLFGLWHIRSLKYMPVTQVIWQCLYTALLLGPLLAYLTLVFGSIYPAIVVHALNNYLSPISQKMWLRIWS